MGKIKFKNGIVEDYTIILSTRDFRHLGQITGIKSDTVEYSANLNSANEFSFTVCKYDLIKDKNFLSDEKYKRYCEEMELLWNRIVDHKLIYVKELGEYYSILVSLEDSAETIKSITATSLCESELSHLNIDTLEVNTEADIEIQSEGYEGTVFYDDEHPEWSLLHRVLADKAPHYSIKYVDASLKKLVRTFSVNGTGTSIYDFLTGEVAEQFNCIFIFDSAKRTISAYDLYTFCKDCEHREEFFTNEEGKEITYCPKCGSKNIKYFGEDTTIYIDKTNLTDSICLETNANETKNALKLEAADDLMSYTIQMLNPNGSEYLYALTEHQCEDMPEDLVEKIKEYNVACESHAPEHEKLVAEYYQLNDELWYLEHSMMPTIEHVNKIEDVTEPKPSVIYTTGKSDEDYKVYVYNATTGNLEEQHDSDAEYYVNLFPKIDVITAQSEGEKLVSELSKDEIAMSVSSMHKNTAVTTINTALKNYAKIFIKSGYVKVEIDTTDEKNDNDEIIYTNSFVPIEYIDEDGKSVYEQGTWTGRFIITNYSDEEDIYTTSTLTLKIDTDYENFLKQKVLKETFGDDEDGSIFNVFDIDVKTEEGLNTFKNALTFYNITSLSSFYEATLGATTALQSAEQAEAGATLFEELYTPYHNMEIACATEINNRQEQIDEVERNIEKILEQIYAVQEELDFRAFLGEEYYKIFCMYRREDTYSNDNYSSEGLSNAEIIDKAKQFIEVAKQELKRISEPKITITSSLKNFLVIPEFKKIVDYFELGNWIRIKVDGVLYKRVRLIGYNISFGNLQEIGVQFSSVTKERNVATDAKEIIQSAKSMYASFGYISKQAEKGNIANDNINNVISDGFNSGLIQIKNNNNEEVTQGKHGILCKSYDDTTGEYSPEQLRFTHNIMAYTDDNWQTVKQAIGKHYYNVYDEDKVNDDGTKGGFVPSTGYGMTADFVNAGYITGSQIISGDIYSENYSSTNHTGSHLDLSDGTFSFAGGKLAYGKNDGVLYVDGIINAEKGGTIAGFNIGDKAIYNETDSLSSTTPGVYIGTNGIRQYSSINANVTISNGILKANGADISGKIIADNGSIGGFNITEHSLKVDNLIDMNSYGMLSIIGASSVDYEEETYYPMAIFHGGSLSLGARKTKSLGDIEDAYNRIIMDCDGLSCFVGKSGSSWFDITNYNKRVTVGGEITTDTLLCYDDMYIEGYLCPHRILCDEYIYAGTNLRFGNDLETSENRGITTYWDDGNTHYIVQRDGSGLTALFGWAGSDEYQTATVLRGQSFHLNSTSGATIQSDERLKKDFINMDKWESFYNSLEPVAFKMKNGSSGRYHMGFKAQQVEQALINNGLSAKDFAGFVKSKYTPDNEDIKNIIAYQDAGINPGDDEYGLIYTEFVAMNTYEIQKLKKDVELIKEFLNIGG